MYRYKLMVLKALGLYKDPNLQKIEALENHGMIDLMTHQFNRYKAVTHFTLPHAIWRSWLER